MIYSGALHNKHGQASRQDLVQTGPYERSRYHNMVYLFSLFQNLSPLCLNFS